MIDWSTVLSAVWARAVYARVGEVSVYVADGTHGGGVGRALLGGLVESSEAARMWALQASIFPKNQVSVALLQRFGFWLMEWRSTMVGCPASPG